MLHLSFPFALDRLIADVHAVLSLAEKEFEKVEYRPIYSRTKLTDVAKIRFQLSRRRKYYRVVYPNSICTFETLTTLTTCSEASCSSFAFTRFTVDSVVIDGEDNYVLTLWY